MVTFLEKKDTQKQLVLILAILITVFIIWQGFSFISAQSEKKPVVSQESFKPTKEVEIDFKILESSFLTELQSFEEIKPIEQEITIGRENPFSAYSPEVPEGELEIKN